MPPTLSCLTLLDESSGCRKGMTGEKKIIVLTIGIGHAPFFEAECKGEQQPGGGTL